MIIATTIYPVFIYYLFNSGNICWVVIMLQSPMFFILGIQILKNRQSSLFPWSLHCSHCVPQKNPELLLPGASGREDKEEKLEKKLFNLFHNQTRSLLSLCPHSPQQETGGLHFREGKQSFFGLGWSKGGIEGEGSVLKTEKKMSESLYTYLQNTDSQAYVL